MYVECSKTNKKGATLIAPLRLLTKSSLATARHAGAGGMHAAGKRRSERAFTNPAASGFVINLKGATLIAPFSYSLAEREGIQLVL